MYPYTHPQPSVLYNHSPVLPQQPSYHYNSHDVTLILRQQPKEALVTTQGKEKARKPVDPPPIIQLQVKEHADPASRHFLQSPYLFMCTSLYKVEKNEAWDGTANKSLAGSLVSSLHRLKDVDNKEDGGFFVFGDISVKVHGTFRLHFSLFDLHKETNEVQYLGAITSEPFRVLLPKDFKGMEESTYLSRAFSDQGVRLRLRKEPRAMMGNKRGFPYVDTPVSNAPIRPNNMYESYNMFDESPTSNKRMRSEAEDTKRDAYVDHTTISAPVLSSSSGLTPSTSFSSPSYPARHQTANLTNSTYNMGVQYPPNFNFSGTTMPAAPYQFRGNVANSGSSNYFSDSILANDHVDWRAPWARDP